MLGLRAPFATALDLIAGCDLTGEGVTPTTVSRLIELLYGRTLCYRAASLPTREVAYHLLLLASDVVRHCGCQGLVLLVDEAESVFTKLPTIRSRAGALRVLSALCHARQFEHIVAVVAVTPDATRQLQSEITAYDLDGCHPTYEPLKRFLQCIGREEHRVSECPSLPAGDSHKLLEKLRQFYTSAYPCMHPLLPSELEQWDALAAQTRSAGLPTRLLIRRTIDLLDALRFRRLGSN